MIDEKEEIVFTVALTPNNPNIQQGRRISKSDRCRRARASKLVDKMPGMAKDARAELPTYTLLDVAKHNSPQDAWIIVAGKVYNVTQFAQEHPGGEDVLLDSAGRDATREFEDVGHSADARARLETLVIGTVRQATDEELRISKDHMKGDRRSRRDAASMLPEMVKWVSAHSSHIKQVGTASAVVLLAVYLAKRYIAPYMPGATKR